MRVVNNEQNIQSSLRTRHNRLQELSQSQQPGYVMRGIMTELHAQAIGIALLEDALHYLERRRVHLATKVLGNTDVPYTSRVKCGLEREAILMAESAVKAEIGREMVRSMRDVV